MRPLAFLLLLAACGPDETLTGYGAAGSWTLSAIDDEAFPSRATIVFEEDGKVSGNAPCNGYGTSQTAPYPWLELGLIRATKRACADLKLEQAYFTALGSMTLVEVSGDVLVLSNDAGKTMTFTRSGG